MNSRQRVRLCVAVALVALVGAPVLADIGAGSLEVAGANSTPTHWDIPVGVPTTATICGVTTAETEDPLPATLDVWVQSTVFGNTMLTATRIDMTDCYEFTYTPPVTACGTTVVSYNMLGYFANNDIADDGIDNDSSMAASGFRFVDEFGMRIECAIPTDSSSWSAVKSLFQ